MQTPLLQITSPLRLFYTSKISSIIGILYISVLILCYHNSTYHKSIVSTQCCSNYHYNIDTCGIGIRTYPIAWVSAVLEPAILAATESVLFIIEQQL